MAGGTCLTYHFAFFQLRSLCQKKLAGKSNKAALAAKAAAAAKKKGKQAEAATAKADKAENAIPEEEDAAVRPFSCSAGYVFTVLVCSQPQRSVTGVLASRPTSRDLKIGECLWFFLVKLVLHWGFL